MRRQYHCLLIPAAFSKRSGILCRLSRSFFQAGAAQFNVGSDAHSIAARLPHGSYAAIFLFIGNQMKQNLIIKVDPELRIEQEIKDNKTFITISKDGPGEVCFIETDKYIIGKELR